MDEQKERPNKDKNYEGIGQFERYSANPFIEEAVTKIQKVTVKKTRKIGADKSAQHLVINQETGELDGYAQFVQIVEVDEEQFAKVYVSQFSSFYELNKSSMKVLHYILSTIKPNSDTFILSLNRCMKFTGYTKFSVFNGLGSLIKNGIIARSEENNEYFINPLILFNGDRVAYTRAYVKRKKNAELNA